MVITMGRCGVPTLTCTLLILFMAALYAKAQSAHYRAGHAGDPNTRYEVSQTILSNPLIRGRQGRVADSGGRYVIESNEPRDSRRENRRTSGRRNGAGRRRGTGPRNHSTNRVGRRTLRRARRLANATTPFATRLLNEFSPRMTSDIVFSPHSIHALMTMTLLGARGRTERQISTVLGLREVRLRGVRGHRAYQALLTSLQHTHRDVHVLSASAVYVRPNIPLELNFRRQLQIMYFASFDTFNMNHPDGPEFPINEFISNQTRGKIQNFLSPGSIDDSTSMLVINALYLNASWANPFNSRLTAQRDFYSLNSGTKSLETMEKTSVFRYANHYNTEVLELPYKGDRLAMYILLPHQTSTIGELLQRLTRISETDDVNPLDQMLDNMQPTFVKVFLPKFKIEAAQLDMTETLRNMGIDKAFDPERANFSGISVADLFISKVIHKAVIEVNEDGTTAAATTAAYFHFRSAATGTPQVLRVNRPFMFIIRDKTMYTILFMGAYLGQTTQGGDNSIQ